MILRPRWALNFHDFVFKVETKVAPSVFSSKTLVVVIITRTEALVICSSHSSSGSCNSAYKLHVPYFVS